MVPAKQFIGQVNVNNLVSGNKRYVIDLFGGEGGAARGYSEAGFTVVGVDNDAERIARYPYSAYLGDWKLGLYYWLNRLGEERIAFIHASPPCQFYSAASEMARARGVAVNYPNLIPPVREALTEVSSQEGVDYVIENVEYAPLRDPVVLCGSMFGLVSTWKGTTVQLKRHRGFEATFPIQGMIDECGVLKAVPVYGHGAPGYREGDDFFKGKGFAKLTKDVMRIDWMSRRGLTESIPPVYSEYVGKAWKAALWCTFTD